MTTKHLKSNGNINVIESSNKVKSIICNETISVLKECIIKRNDETNHSQNHPKFKGSLRLKKYDYLKRW